MSSFLFPTPSLPKSGLTPSHFPGVSPESTNTLQTVLKDNHTRWHTFFNEQRFHNHAAHRAIAAWALGADAHTIQSAYERDCDYEKPAFESPGTITLENFNDHLGDEKYYNAYKDFFTSYVKDEGVAASIENFILSRKANLGSDISLPNEKQPQMLSRFLNGVLHPLIHTGYGAEFTLPGMVVEGLAQTAVHYSSPVADLLVQLKLFDYDTEPGQNIASAAGQTIKSVLGTTVNAVGSALDKTLPEGRRPDLSFVTPSSSDTSGKADGSKAGKFPAGPHALTILSRVLSDPQFFAPKAAADDENNMFEHTIRTHGKALAEYVSQWHVTGDNIEKRIEEVVWSVCVLYGVAGWTHSSLTEKKKFNADFFFMHLITSSIFLPALCAVVPPASQVRLLKAYFATALTWAVARGRPSLDVKGFVEASQDPKFMSAPSSKPTWESTWLRMIEEARSHHDEHLTKIIRSLAGWAAAFGTRKSRAQLPPNATGVAENKLLTENEAYGAGIGMGKSDDSATGKEGISSSDEATKTGAADFVQSDVPATDNNSDLKKDRRGLDGDENVLPKTELPGAEYLDGHLFAMVAALTLNRMGWELDGTWQREKWVKKEGQRDEEEFWDFVGFFPPDPNARL